MRWRVDTAFWLILVDCGWSIVSPHRLCFLLGLCSSLFSMSSLPLDKGCSLPYYKSEHVHFLKRVKLQARDKREQHILPRGINQLCLLIKNSLVAPSSLRFAVLCAIPASNCKLSMRCSLVVSTYRTDSGLAWLLLP